MNVSDCLINAQVAERNGNTYFNKSVGHLVTHNDKSDFREKLEF